MSNDAIEAINRVQKYIKDNLSEKITLYQLSRAANYSIPQLERVFKKTVGLSPFEYIRKLRLTAAAQVLRDKNPKVIETALDFLFDSHEGFTRAFSKEFGITPNSYKKSPIPLKFFVAYEVQKSKSYQKTEESEKMKTVTIFTQVIERAERKAIIKRGKKATDYYEFCEEVGCDDWGILLSIKGVFEPAGFWLPKNMIKPGTSEYVQGIEVPANYDGTLPSGFEMIDLPACKYMVFNSEEFSDEDYEEVISATWQAIEKYNPKTYGYEWDDTQPRFQLEPRGERGYIEARPIKSISR